MSAYTPVGRCERCSAHARKRITVYPNAKFWDEQGYPRPSSAVVFAFCDHHAHEQIAAIGDLNGIDVDPVLAETNPR